MLCDNIEEIYWIYKPIIELAFFVSPWKTNFCIKTMNSSQNILLLSLMSKTILLVVFGIITGLKICWFSNISRFSIKWGNPINSFNTLFQPMLNYCRKFGEFDYFWRYHIVKSVHFLGDTRYERQEKNLFSFWGIWNDNPNK